MRGTDGANTTVPNTVAPDNAGITANGVAIGNLNDFNPAITDVTTDATSREASKATITIASNMIEGFATEVKQNIMQTSITDQTLNLKGVDNKDLSQVFDNTPDIDLTEVTDAIDAQTIDLKGVGNKDLTEVYNNTPDVNLGTMPDDITAIRDSQLGDWEIINNQHVMKKENGDMLKTFDLFDQYGNPTVTSPFRREGV
jgi:hypothetical protein